jgi:uncharacterized protein YaiE (UPF0345 family)
MSSAMISSKPSNQAAHVLIAHQLGCLAGRHLPGGKRRNPGADFSEIAVLRHRFLLHCPGAGPAKQAERKPCRGILPLALRDVNHTFKGGTMSNRFDHVSIEKRANVYMDGKVVSFNLIFPDGSKKTVGVIMPSTVRFAADTAENVEILDGKCRVQIGNDGAWKSFEGGQRFHVPAQARFDIEVFELVRYVNHKSAA